MRGRPAHALRADRSISSPCEFYLHTNRWVGDGQGVEQLRMSVGIRPRQDSDSETSRRVDRASRGCWPRKRFASDAGEDARLVESSAKTGAHWEADQGSFCEPPQGNAGFGRQRVPVGDGGHEWLVFDDLGVDSSGVSDYRADPRQVELARPQRVEQVAGGGFAEGDFDRWVVVVEIGEEAR